MARPPSQTDEDAAEIYQRFLDETAVLLLSGDAEGFARRVALPCVLRTVDGETVMETWDDVVADIREIIQMLQGLQLTDFIRLVRAARFVDPFTIEGWHRTYAMRHANAVTTPYDSRVVFKQVDGVWKVALSEHELKGHGRFPVSVLRAAPGGLATQWESARAQVNRPPLRAERVYAAYLDSLDRAARANDFEAWTKHFAFPMAWHLVDSDRLMQNADDMREPFFKSQNNLVIDGRPTRMQRTVTAAEFLQDGRILGYHHIEWRDGDEVLFGPIASRVVLRMQDGQLAAESISNNLDAAVFDTGTFARGGDLPTFREIQRRAQARDAGPATYNKDDKT